MLTAVTGINWGDEGKGRVIDLLAENADIVARYQGGNNAGHTVVTRQGKFVLNLLPSGILHPNVVCVLGTGMVIDLDHLANEIASIEQRGITISPEHLKLSAKATISMPWHRVQDGLEEDRLAKKGMAFGSTRRGIAYAYSDKYRKKTLRLGDLLHLDEERIQSRLHVILESKNMELAGCYHQEPMSYDALLHWCRTQVEKFAPYICDAGAYLQQASNAGKRIVLEAQLGAMRDIDYGIFPFTSSSNTLAAYAPLGAGIPNVKLDHVVGVLKAYSTCVGAGPFAAEKAMPENWMQALRKAGGEFGAATGRPRRVGPFDCVASRYGLACQGADKIALTKLDVLSGMKEIPVITGYKLDGAPVEAFDPTDDQDRMEPVVTMLPGWDCDISRCTRYDELPDTAKNYIEFLEKQLVHTIQFISTGAAREQYLLKGAWLTA
ncbi:adenylosuccinate synthase [uncultured Gemmiger sp.]|uniref:adenylosuccinate synthase n=1 Tax=uncultured Gemmiger sp. TaxID=1623490 RepID=UPI0025FE4C25|nr:adenylosuccinate synthase [uncultured Gemmiger sp.]